MKYVSNKKIGDSWKQPIQFVENTKRIFQKESGPCGFLSVLQAYIILNYKKDKNKTNEDLLIESTLDIMKKIRNIFAFCQIFDEDHKEIMIYSTNDETEARQFLEDSGFFDNSNSILLFLVSLAYIAGPALLSSYAFQEGFIANNGQTSIQLVLLMLTGLPADSVSDVHTVQGGMLISGVLLPQDIGLLVVDEEESLSKVGYPLLSPQEKIWIIYYGGHFTTIAILNDCFCEYNNIIGSAEEYSICNSNHILFSVLTELV